MAHTISCHYAVFTMTSAAAQRSVFGKTRSRKLVALNEDSVLRPQASVSEWEDDSVLATSERPSYETRSLRFRESSSAQSQSHLEGKDEPVALITKSKNILSTSPLTFYYLYSVRKRSPASQNTFNIYKKRWRNTPRSWTFCALNALQENYNRLSVPSYRGSQIMDSDSSDVRLLNILLCRSTYQEG